MSHFRCCPSGLVMIPVRIARPAARTGSYLAGLSAGELLPAMVVSLCLGIILVVKRTLLLHSIQGTAGVGGRHELLYRHEHPVYVPVNGYEQTGNVGLITYVLRLLTSI